MPPRHCEVKGATSQSGKLVPWRSADWIALRLGGIRVVGIVRFTLKRSTSCPLTRSGPSDCLVGASVVRHSSGHGPHRRAHQGILFRTGHQNARTEHAFRRHQLVRLHLQRYVESNAARQPRYFILPIVNVAIGTLFFNERMRRPQWDLSGIRVAGVVVLIVGLTCSVDCFDTGIYIFDLRHYSQARPGRGNGRPDVETFLLTAHRARLSPLLGK